jgi:hypothetical protein
MYKNALLDKINLLEVFLSKNNVKFLKKNFRLFLVRVPLTGMVGMPEGEIPPDH